jgi:hypothetical protein
VVLVLHIQIVDGEKCAMMQPERRKNHMAAVNNGSNDQEQGLPIPDERFREAVHQAWYDLLGETLADQQHLWGKERRAIAAEAEAIIATMRAKIAELSTKFERMIAEKLATLRDGAQGSPGEQGQQGPPGRDGRLHLVREWFGAVHYAGDLVHHDGSLWQCTRDTGHPPPHPDWSCIARRGVDGRTPVIRGTWSPEQTYERLDIIARDGTAFIARRDNPGNCPGEDWQLLAMPRQKGGARPLRRAGRAR